ncbi:MAG: type II toxin-antitoxin system VapB family antitoxin [Acidobacteriota bacterium]
MPTNLAINDKLIEEAKRLGRFQTKKAAVTAALEEFIRRRKQARILKLEGTVDYIAGYDHKTSRRAR